MYQDKGSGLRVQSNINLSKELQTKMIYINVFWNICDLRWRTPYLDAWFVLLASEIYLMRQFNTVNTHSLQPLIECSHLYHWTEIDCFCYFRWELDPKYKTLNSSSKLFGYFIHDLVITSQINNCILAKCLCL